MPRKPPSPIVHVSAEYQATVHRLLAAHGLSPEIRRSDRPGLVELRFGHISDAALLAWLSELPEDALGLRAIVGGDPFDQDDG